MYAYYRPNYIINISIIIYFYYFISLIIFIILNLLKVLSYRDNIIYLKNNSKAIKDNIGLYIIRV